MLRFVVKHGEDFLTPAPQALESVGTAAYPAEAAVVLAEAAVTAAQGLPAAGASSAAGAGTPAVPSAAELILPPPSGGRPSRRGDIPLESLLRALQPLLLQGGRPAPAVERFAARLLCGRPSLVR